MSRPAPRSCLVPLVLAAVLAVSGCGDTGDGGSTEPTAAPTTSPSPTEPSPTVVPADGKWMKVPGAKIRTPKGYLKVTDYLGLVMTRRDPDIRAYIALSPVLQDGTPTLDQLARRVRDKDFYVPRGSKRLDDVVVGGTLYGFHFRDTSDDQQITDVYGMVNHGGEWIVTFDFPRIATHGAKAMNAQERQELIDSVLATFENIYPE